MGIEKAEGTSTSNTVDEDDSNDEERQGHTTTESANGDDKILSMVHSTWIEQVLESSKASLSDCRSVCCISETEQKAYHLIEKGTAYYSSLLRMGESFWRRGTIGIHGTNSLPSLMNN